MAENLLDNARTQMAGLPYPKTFNSLKRMYRSVLEEINRVLENNGDNYGDELFQKLEKLKDYLYDFNFLYDITGNFNLRKDSDAYKIEYQLNNGMYKKPLSNKWLYKDDGAMNPIDAAYLYDRLQRIVSTLVDHNYEYKNTPNPWSRPEVSAKNFFKEMDELNGLVQGIPGKLLNDNQVKAYLSSFMAGNKLPTKVQIELDPLLYTDSKWNVISDYAKSFVQ